MGRLRLKQDTHRRLVLGAQRLTLGGLGLAVCWNLVSLFLGSNGWWPALVLPWPGLLAWVAALAAPHLLAKTAPAEHPHTYRLLYSAAPGWDDTRARQSLLTLMRSGVGLDIIWARDGQEIGCWLATSGYKKVLERMVLDVFQDGSLEVTPALAVGPGVVVLHWQPGVEIPPAAELCQMEGVEGVYFRWRSETSAIVALWGSGAETAARQFAQHEALLPGRGPALLSPEFSGDNPWPELPRFLSSEDYAGLSAVSRLERIAPGLRVNGTPALTIGRDSEGQPVGFALPDLAGMQLLRVIGQATNLAIIELVQQAIQANRPAFVLDGQGVITTRLARRLLREVATEKVLMCDVERPAQSRFRLNPLWLPDTGPARDRALASGWLDWLRELGVTTGGLGQVACRHTLVAVMLTALATTQRGLVLDPPGLREALLTPDFLALLGENFIPGGRGILDDEAWAWWLEKGRHTTSFDVHLRLAHLRDRLGALLDLPEYSVLWQGPYLNPLVAASSGQNLFWRLPDPRRRLSAYVTSQLLALTTLLTAWPADRPPLLLFLHELDIGSAWIERLRSFPNVRLVISTERVIKLWPKAHRGGLLVSRLDDESAERVQAELPDIKATDLRRLPPARLLLQQGSEVSTVEMKREYGVGSMK